MTWADGLATLWADETLYLTISCIVSALLVVTEIALLALRQRAILGHLGWTDLDLGPTAFDSLD